MSLLAAWIVYGCAATALIGSLYGFSLMVAATADCVTRWLYRRRVRREIADWIRRRRSVT